ncbi:hypothetical protein [Sphingobacterium psychroaquaticum]|uniref:Uncharacterized protein n=1 Tax=Sphingobacterium psychroaquaticum TaxID=561061 RepID=A0A1X7LEE7_9SPHI|nr:hypothetical protein [Sphingobacterium psychroaquaticum]QBQ41272.1 hypothetical protein E2P86_08930 [Sphingobacterium psychroaquaticum]SMG51632.1 hypothetical protein SAMN05660862_0005 [Sphingobacterium psychroaquaticum]
MAKQSGIIKLKGTIGDITFYKSQDGYLAREKGGVDRARIMSDPKFQRTRENAAEFGQAGKASKLLFGALRPVIRRAKDGRAFSRLVREMLKVIQSNPVERRGERSLTGGDLTLLRGFDFNRNAPLSTTFYAPSTWAIDRTAGTAVVEVPEFNPMDLLSSPRGTTHFRFISAVVGIDFYTEEFSLAQEHSVELFYESDLVPTVTHRFDISGPLFERTCFLVFGVEFLQEVNGMYYSLNNGSYNPLNVVVVGT